MVLVALTHQLSAKLPHGDLHTISDHPDIPDNSATNNIRNILLQLLP